MKKTLAIAAAAVLAGSMYSCKKEPPANHSQSTERIKEINDVCTDPPIFLGVRTIGGASYDLGQELEVAANGNVMVSGIFQKTVDFNPGQGVFNLNAEPTVIGNVTHNFGRFKQTSNAAGSFINAEDLGPDMSAYGSVVDAQGNRYVPGYEKDAVLKKSKLTVTKFNAAGKQLGKIYTDTTTAAGTVCKLHLNNGYVYVSAPHGKLFKYNTNGTLIWAKPTANGLAHLATDAAGNLYVAGLATRYIEKYTSEGDLLWSIRNGNKGEVKAHDIAVDGSGNIYTLGGFGADTDFDPGTGTHILTEGGLFIQKLNSSGKYVWAVQTKNVTGSVIMMYAIALDAAAENIYVAGGFAGKPNFNTSGGTSTAQSNGSSDVFVMGLRQCK